MEELKFCITETNAWIPFKKNFFYYGVYVYIYIEGYVLETFNMYRIWPYHTDSKIIIFDILALSMPLILFFGLSILNKIWHIVLFHS